MNKKKPKKIIHVIARLNVGGPAVHVSLLVKSFNSEGWQSLLVTGVHGSNEGDMSYLAEHYGVKPLILPALGRDISLWSDLKVAFQLFRLFLREKPDIVCTHTAKGGTLGRLAAFFAGVPKVYHTFHGHVFSGYFSPLKTKVFIYIEKVLAFFCTAIISISIRQKHDLVSYGIAKPAKIKVIPLGLDFSRFLPVDESRSLRTGLGIEPGFTTIAMIGRLTAIKAPHLFIKAAHAVLKKKQDVHFLIIGDGELKAECEAEVQRLGITDSFSFPGFLQDLKVIYGSVDIVCLTSLNEGTPVSLLEAMACGKLVISTPVGGVPDFVHDGVNGFLCAAEPVAFAEKILACLEDPEGLQHIRQQAAQDILRDFSLERLHRDMEQLFGE
jgi:glycosyltransferase involved in cell wall biosynthesis